MPSRAESSPSMICKACPTSFVKNESGRLAPAHLTMLPTTCAADTMTCDSGYVRSGRRSSVSSNDTSKAYIHRVGCCSGALDPGYHRLPARAWHLGQISVCSRVCLLTDRRNRSETLIGVVAFRQVKDAMEDVFPDTLAPVVAGKLEAVRCNLDVSYAYWHDERRT